MFTERTVTNHLLDRYAEALTLESDYQIAKALGVTRQAVSHWRNEKCTLDDTACLQIAEALKIDPLTIMAKVRESRKQTPREQATWERYRGRVALAVMAAIIAGGTDVAEARPQGNSPQNSHLQAIYYAQIARRWWLRCARHLQQRLRANSLIPQTA
jgi:transcriptional regulator with XRE-family HTH domain